MLLYSFIGALIFVDKKSGWIREWLLEFFAMEAVLEILAYSVFAWWLVIGTDCHVSDEICEAVHDMNIVVFWFKWIAIYIPYKMWAGAFLYSFAFNRGIGPCMGLLCCDGSFPEYATESDEDEFEVEPLLGENGNSVTV